MATSKFKKRRQAEREEQRSKLKRFRIGLGITWGFEIVLVIVILLIGAKTEHIKTNCTESVSGVVVSVKAHKERVANINPNHGVKYIYETVFTTTISVKTDGAFGKSQITTNDGHYKEGQELKIFYNPGDPSDYYIEDELERKNTAQTVIIVIAVMWAALCLLLTWVTIKQHKKCISGKIDIQ